MIKIPFLNKFITDDQEFYDVQINEEFKYCNSKNLAMKFIEVGKIKRAIVIKNKEKPTIALIFMKHDYKGINEALEKIRFNLALEEKESSLNSLEGNVILNTSSKKYITVDGKNDEKATLIISTINELLINNEPLKEKEDAIKRLFDLSLQYDREEPYLDFNKAGYDAGLQNYLIMNLYKENISLNDRLVNALAFYKAKEPKFYHLANSFLRGNFDEMFRYINTMKNPINITSIAKICQNIIQAQEELPDRSYDLMIYRAGLGVNKNKMVGAENTYESFVSFGTSGGILGDPTIKDSSPFSLTLWHMELLKSSKLVLSGTCICS